MVKNFHMWFHCAAKFENQWFGIYKTQADPNVCRFAEARHPSSCVGLRVDVENRQQPRKQVNGLYIYSCMHAQLCPTLCNPMDHTPPASSVHGVFQQEHWSGLPFLPPGGLPVSGVEPVLLALAGGFFTTEPPGQAIPMHIHGIS